MAVATFDPNAIEPLTLTSTAIARLRNLIGEEPFFRVYVTGGGCSGFQYGFKLDSERLPDDTVVEFDGVEVLVDSLSIQYIFGSIVDFTEDLMGAKFVVKNPNATTSCSCGSSFAI